MLGLWRPIIVDAEATPSGRAGTRPIMPVAAAAVREVVKQAPGSTACPYQMQQVVAPQEEEEEVAAAAAAA